MWTICALGNAGGTVRWADGESGISPGAPVRPGPGPFTVRCEGGKLGDSADSFLFLYTSIDPFSENFRLSARLTAEPGGDPDYQAGFGLMAADTVASENAYCQHRNSILCGAFGREHGAGVRLVAGYTRADAFEPAPVRIYDDSRRFSGAGPWRGSHALTLEKTDRGFTASLDGQQLRVEGCDFLMRQDGKRLYVGVAAAGTVTLRVEALRLETSPGCVSAAPEGELRPSPGEWPFFREPAPRSTKRRSGLIVVSPDGTPEGDGTGDAPWDLHTALAAAGPGTEILLEDGTYTTDRPFDAAAGGDSDRPIRLRARHVGRAVLDGSAIRRRAPLLLLRGSRWRVEGLTFTASPMCGVLITGSYNDVLRCGASENGDTGILICGVPGSERETWPAFNRILDCDSHDNCDPVRKNADGFGAKLRIGEGNLFFRCMAHHNADDGFDLYAKSAIGPTGAVLLESCVAYDNGHLSGEAARPDGVGFKLGGEHQAVEHTAQNCLAWGNGRCGFSANSNPACRILRCTAAENGGGERSAQFSFSAALEPRWETRGLLHTGFPGARLLFRSTDRSAAPVRRADGSIELHGLFIPRLRLLPLGADPERAGEMN